MRRIGGSDIPKLLGISKYGNAADVYLRIAEGLESEWNPRMERGAAVEPQLRAHGQRMFGIELESPASDVAVHQGVEFAHAQIDDLARWNGMPVAIDYKSQSSFAKGWGRGGTDDVPEQYRIQMAWELACSDRELGLLIVGFGDDAPAPELFHIANVVPYQIQRDGVTESQLLQIAREFWEAHILPRVPPAMAPIGLKPAKTTKSKEATP